MILASQSCRERKRAKADERTACCAERLSHSLQLFLTVGWRTRVNLSNIYMLAQQNTAQTCPDSAQRQLCTSHVLSFTRLMPFREYVCDTSNGRPRGRCPLIMQLLDDRVFSIFDLGSRSLLERENASA
jgi:hypothetical protein